MVITLFVNKELVGHQLVRHPDVPINTILKRVLDLLSVMTLERVSENIFFQCNKFMACKIKDEKELTNSLMVFNVLNIIHPSLCKKHLRTKRNLNCHSQAYLIGYYQD